MDFYSKVLRVKSLKKRKPEARCVPINEYLIGDMGAWIAQKGLRGNDRLFGITRQRGFQIVKDACCKAGIELTLPNT
ncbi:MAG: hypothetical protein ACUZ77_00765 [Candidatus Brocadiales bacterium]